MNLSSLAVAHILRQDPLGIETPALGDPIASWWNNVDAANDLGGVERIPATVTLNSLETTADFRYKASDAGATWAGWGTGGLLTAQAGGVDLDKGSPLPGGAFNTSIRGNGTGYYLAGENNTGELGTKDIWFEILLKVDNWVGGSVVKKHAGGATGWNFYTAGVEHRFLLQLPAGLASVQTNRLEIGGWYWITVAIDRSYSSATDGGCIFVNKAAGADQAADFSALAADLSQPDPFGILGSNWINKDNVAYTAMYLRDNWFPGDATNKSIWLAMHNERFLLASGQMPDVSAGTATPNIVTRSTPTHIYKENASGNVELYMLGRNWAPISKLNSQVGIMPEGAGANLLLYSTDFSNAAWTKTNVSPNYTAEDAPNREEISTGIITDDETDVSHGFTQTSQALTAATHVMYCFAKKGEDKWLYMADDTIVAGWAYFDTEDGEAGAKGAGIIGSGVVEDFGENGDYALCWATFTGTVATHDFTFLAADDDEGGADPTYEGNTSDIDLYICLPQVNLGVVPRQFMRNVASKVARGADAFQIKGDDGNWGGDPGTVKASVFNLFAHTTPTAKTIVYANDNSADEVVEIKLDTSGNANGVSAESGGNAGETIENTVDVLDGADHDLTLKHMTDNLVIDSDGTAAAPDTSADITAAIDRIDIGATLAGTQHAGELIHDLHFYDTYNE